MNNEKVLVFQDYIEQFRVALEAKTLSAEGQKTELLKISSRFVEACDRGAFLIVEEGDLRAMPSIPFAKETN